MRRPLLPLVAGSFLALSALGAQARPGFYSETMNFRIEWKGIRAGDVTMRSRPEGNNYVTINARVNSLPVMHGIYYVQGVFAAKWNYASRTPVIAFEEAYQGDTYQRRKFRFAGRNVKVEKFEKRFHELSFPHSEPAKSQNNETYDVSTSGGYQDLLGAFYYVRSTGKIPKVGEVLRVPVLPAGSRRTLVLKVLAREKRNDVPFFGSREVFHVKSALADEGKGKQPEGNIFFNTKSQIDMWITADENFVPVKIWTEVPFLGTAYILLENYSQP